MHHLFDKSFANDWLVVFWWIGVWGVVDSCVTKANLNINTSIQFYVFITVASLLLLYFINNSFTPLGYDLWHSICVHLVPKPYPNTPPYPLPAVIFCMIIYCLSVFSPGSSRTESAFCAVPPWSVGFSPSGCLSLSTNTLFLLSRGCLVEIVRSYKC